MTSRCFTRCWQTALVLITAGLGLKAAELEPVGSGRFAIACTNLEVTAVESGTMFGYLNGKVTPTGLHYVTDILKHPEAVPTVQVDVPVGNPIFGPQSGTRLPVVLLVVYPTSAENTRADYAFPYTETGDRVFTHMQQPGDKPVLPQASAKYPLIIFSGGYNTHGLWHLSHLKDLAAHGYIVVDLFHGDGRASGLPTSAALRSLAVRAALDFMLQRSDFAAAIDAERIGAVGESAGGHTVLAALGGIDPAGKMPPGADPRIKAAVGIVPFMGGSLGFWPFKVDLWFFGEDHAGLREVRRPFLALYAEKDPNVLPDGVEAGLRALSGPTIGVRLDGESHGLSAAATSDLRTWELTFFDAWLRDNRTARELLQNAISVRGGVSDHKTYSAVGPR